MTLPVPKLDDRRFDQLVAAAVERVRATCPEWQDLSPGDPGLTLIEVFAFLTENMIYRLNRVPEKLYITLMNLVGAELRAPSAATVTLRFSRLAESSGDVEIPAGAQVSTNDGSVTFVVTQATVLKEGKAFVDAPAIHSEAVEGELVGPITGQSFRVGKPPIIAPSGDSLDVILGVEAGPGEAANQAMRSVGGKAFVVWRPVATYAEAAAEPQTFIVDRASGLVVFPGGAADLGDKEVRVWYRRGGGRSGNVVAGALTVLKAPGFRLSVTNPEAASGGSDVESLQSAVSRTPIAASSMRVAVTARDFEREASAVGGIARARALALAQQWRHADPGVVDLLIVPSIAVDTLPEGAVTANAVKQHRSESLRNRVLQVVDAKRPLGVRVSVDWAKVRPVSVSGRIVVTRGENVAAAGRAVRTRLNALFSPFNPQPFGRALRASDAYEAILAEPSVRYADQLRFSTTEAPSADISDLAHDPHQPRTWFAVTSSAIHRSLDDGDSWSVIHEAAGEAPKFVRRHPERAGLICAGVARSTGGAIHLSTDCGETWSLDEAVFDTEVTDAAWSVRDGTPLLLVSTASGVMQLQPGSGMGPAPVTVDPEADANGYYAVAVSTSPSGAITVAVAARKTGGVYLSAAGGVSSTFKAVGLEGEDVRTLVVQRHNARDFLWAGVQAVGKELGSGAHRLELNPDGQASGGTWRVFNDGWEGGSCHDLVFANGQAFAASERSGVLILDPTSSSPAWSAVRFDAGLPIRQEDRALEATKAVGAASLDPNPVLFAGGPAGLYRSLNGGDRFTLASAEEFTDRIPLPANWLYCAGDHALSVVEEDEG